MEERSNRQFMEDKLHGEHGYEQNRLNIPCTADCDEADINNRLVMNLRDLGHMLRFMLEGKGSQKRILIILYESGQMTQRELTEQLGIQPGSASEVIRKLENVGLIRRTPSGTDRRTTDIQLTPAGQIQAEEASRQRKLLHQELFSCLSADEKATLLALAEKLDEDWDSRYRENRKSSDRDIHNSLENRTWL